MKFEVKESSDTKTIKEHLLSILTSKALDYELLICMG